MAKITASKKIVLEDFPEEIRGWLKKLVEPLNRYLEQSYAALTDGITYRDNLKSKVYSVAIRAGETQKQVRWDLSERPTAVYIANIRTNANNPPTSAFAMSWKLVEGQIIMEFVGLNALTDYTATIVGQV